MKRKYIVLIMVVIIVLAFLLITNIINPLDKSCNIDSVCVLAYTGLESCGPCDDSSSEMQCVSLREAEEIQNRRDLSVVKTMCEMCPSPQILYRCVCGQNGCEKTTSCSVDSDCITQSFSGDYACIDNQCKRVVT
jgi:hypothetical protein